MAEVATEHNSIELEDPNVEETECSFVWDEQSKLYFHARSGFYHDPVAGWYYSTKDGLYYKFENGSYVLMESSTGKGHDPEAQPEESVALKNPFTEACNEETTSNDDPDAPRPTSEWLEDTLIDMYLSGYSNPVASADEYTSAPLDAQDGNEGDYELEEGEFIPDHDETEPVNTEQVTGLSCDEENWLTQYGQVTEPVDVSMTNISSVDLWDWEVVTSERKDGKGQAFKLVGRLVKRNTKLHPSMPASGRILKTAPIIEALRDLVRVRSGQVYKLRNPSAKYQASLSIYDSSNPTWDWGFPSLSVDKPISPPLTSSGFLEAEASSHGKEKIQAVNKVASTFEKKTQAYRDRAAERRNLHGGYGIGPGQKKSIDDDANSPPSSSIDSEIAAAEALDLSFGAGSYSQKLLKKMGWKEGDTLGKTNKGLKEPLQAIRNKGNAGLGWT